MSELMKALSRPYRMCSDPECGHRLNHHREGGSGRCGLCRCSGFLPGDSQKPLDERWKRFNG